MSRRRLDQELVDRGLAASRAQAQRAIESGRVLVGGVPAPKPGRLVSPDDQIVLTEPARFASRGGEKLAGALGDLGIEAGGRRCLDVGAGSGGFTDCLLQAGAREVVSVDVGYGQFDWRLRNDSRVRLIERTNFRTMDLEALAGPFDLVVADLSFISLTLVLDRLIRAVHPSGDLLLLVKPQFEAGRGEVGKGGVVRDPEVAERAVRRVVEALAERGRGTAGLVPSRLRGASGNQEFFVWARADARPADERLIRQAIALAS